MTMPRNKLIEERIELRRWAIVGSAHALATLSARRPGGL
jgi:hypothetical protein